MKKKSLTEIGGHCRHGDVLLRRIAKIPANKKQVKPVLALGEVTGHSHVLDNYGTICFADNEKDLADFAQVESPAKLTHQEHSTIVLPPGNYEKLYQVEDTSKEVRPVQD